MRTIVLFAAVAAGSIATAGCSKKAEECNKVVNIIDDDDSAVSKAASSLGPDPASVAKALKDLGAVVTKVGDDLKATTITSPDLKTGVDAYIAACTEGASAFDTEGSALSKFLGSESAKTDPFDRVAAIRVKLDTRCQAPGNASEAKPAVAAKGKAPAKPASGKSPSSAAAASAPASGASIAEDCRMIGTIVRGVVNTANPALEADQFTAAINQLEALHVGDPQLKSDLAQYVQLLQDVVSVDRAAASFQTSVKKLGTDSDKATSEINTACGAS